MGIAMMVEVLAAARGQRSHDGAAEAAGAEKRRLVDRRVLLVRRSGPSATGAFDSYMAQWTGFYLASAPDAARLPGQRAAELERAALETGIVLSDATVRELRVLGDNLGVQFPA
jgi:LDH2 family malate/lactate/ureidoglycolate dehydrogenase